LDVLLLRRQRLPPRLRGPHRPPFRCPDL